MDYKSLGFKNAYTSRDWHLSNEVDGRLLDKDQAANRMWGAREATIKTFKEKD